MHETGDFFPGFAMVNRGVFPVLPKRPEKVAYRRRRNVRVKARKKLGRFSFPFDRTQDVASIA
jgi:hypothetical protein